jgi:hypothetical protein
MPKCEPILEFTNFDYDATLEEYHQALISRYILTASDIKEKLYDIKYYTIFDTKEKYIISF